MLSRSTRLGATSVLALLALPAATYAFSVEDIIESAQAGNGTVVETHSSANTGGQTAQSGETVTTNDVSVSSHTQTSINAGGSGGTVEVKVEKTVNGVTETKEYAEDIPAGSPVNVKVDAHATTDTSEDTDIESPNDVEVQIVTSAEAESDAPNFFTDTVPHFFKKVVSFFLWF